MDEHIIIRGVFGIYQANVYYCSKITNISYSEERYIFYNNKMTERSGA